MSTKNLLPIKPILATMLCCIFFHASKAQLHYELTKNLSANTPFKKVQQTVDAYFDKQTVKSRDWRQWKRFEWLAQRRLNSDGVLEDVVARNKVGMSVKSQMNAAAKLDGLTATHGTWYGLGPTGSDNGDGNVGRVVCMAFHPTDANTWYIGTPAGGMWRTTNNGSSYTPLTDNLPGLGVASIVVHPTNPNIIYILTGDGNAMNRGHYLKERGTGVYKTTDGGTTWNETAMIWDYSSQTYGFKLMMQPNNPNVLLAATSSGMWRSLDAGAHWANTSSAIAFTDIEFKPGSNSVVFASGYSGSMYYSSDTGRTWNSRVIANGTDRMELEVTANNNNRIYALCGPGTLGAFKGLYKYSGTNYASGTWTTVRTAPNIFGYANDGTDDASQTWRNISMYASDADENLLFTGGSFIWKSTNGGTSIAKSSGVIHADNHFILKHPLNSTLYSGCDGGLFKSTDAGVSWSSISAGLQITQFYRFDASANTFGVLIAGAQDNSQLKRNSGSNNYKVMSCCDGMDAAMDYTDNNIMYGCIQSGYVYKSTNGTDMNAAITQPTAADDYWVTNIVMHNTDHNTLFFGGTGGIKRTTNAGNNWSSIGASGKDGMAQGTSNLDRMYAADGLTVRMSTNVNAAAASVTWTNISGSAPNYPTDANVFITAMAVNPDNSFECWITLSGFIDGQKVYRTEDAGTTWQNMSAGLPNLPVHSIAYEDNNSSPAGAVYIGTEIGVFYRNNTLGAWIPYGNSLPNSPVTDLKIVDFSGTKYLYASTFGRGMWYTTAYSGCVPYIFTGATSTGYNYIEARDSVYSFGTMAGNVGTEIYLKAGNYIRLGPGATYSATNGTMRAFIGSCGSGGIPNAAASAQRIGVVDADDFFTQTPEPVKQMYTEPLLKKLPTNQYTLGFNSDGKNEMRISIKDERNETLGYFVRAVLEKGNYEITLPKMKATKPLWLIIESNGQQHTLKL